MFKMQFWAGSWHEEKNWDIETEDPETIHASVHSFFQEFSSCEIYEIIHFELRL